MGHTKATGKVIRYAGYDRKTGRIVHMHARFSVQENRFVEIPIEELRARFSTDTVVVGKLADRDPANLDFIQVDLAHVGERLGHKMVDPEKRRLVERPHLALSASKHEILGDGKDSADIRISLVDSHGKTLTSGSGAVKITVDRGRLSARGGIVNLARGKATITLTSANETVGRVRVSAASPDRAFAPATLDVAFV